MSMRAANIVSLFNRRRSGPQDWSQSELAQFYRVEAALIQAGLNVEQARGLTDEGEPWLVYCHADSGDIFVHFARIDGVYIVDSPAMADTLFDRDFPSLVSRLAGAHPFLLPHNSQPKNVTRLYLHPAALLVSAMAVLFFKTAPADAGDGSADGLQRLADLTARPAGQPQFVLSEMQGLVLLTTIATVTALKSERAQPEDPEYIHDWSASDEALAIHDMTADIGSHDDALRLLDADIARTSGDVYLELAHAAGPSQASSVDGFAIEGASTNLGSFGGGNNVGSSISGATSETLRFNSLEVKRDNQDASEEGAASVSEENEEQKPEPSRLSGAQANSDGKASEPAASVRMPDAQAEAQPISPPVASAAIQIENTASKAAMLDDMAKAVGSPAEDNPDLDTADDAADPDVAGDANTADPELDDEEAPWDLDDEYSSEGDSVAGGDAIDSASVDAILSAADADAVESQAILPDPELDEEEAPLDPDDEYPSEGDSVAGGGVIDLAIVDESLSAPDADEVESEAIRPDPELDIYDPDLDAVDVGFIEFEDGNEVILIGTPLSGSEAYTDL